MGQDDKAVTAVADWHDISEIFAANAREHPAALAVEAQGERRSYAELAARVDLFAARLADRLRDRPVDGDLLIGTCLTRDVDCLAWLLAVFQVGGAYVPIDPTTPPTRLAHLLEDAQPALIVVSRCYADALAGIDVPVIIAEDDPAAPLAPAPIVSIRPDMLAYVIFTSGSTGRPKGVEIEHGSLVALLTTMAVTPGLSKGERMLGLTRMSFDVSVPDLFLPLFVGGSLALVDSEVAADPRRLAEGFDSYRPDVAQGTPSTWRALVEAGWQGQPDLRIIAGGEALNRALADSLLPKCGELWNIYGPTETTVWSTAHRVEPGDGAVSIGWPITGYKVHVAGADGAPLPLGEVGEIVIGGVGVARGYRNRPDLTADRFVTQADGTRSYRTGDLGRFDEMGALYCLGRLDDQVKVRGFRIELGDVEAALVLHPAVAWGAVRLWTDPSGEAVLVGYFVPRPGAAPTVRDLKAFLATQLVPYMVPDRMIALAAMPLTPNKKIDRSALLDPFTIAADVLPTSSDDDTETRLAAIWRDVLGVGSVSVDDDFFDLGGYSLMTVRLARRIEEEFGVDLALIELLRHSTLGAMAGRIEHGDVPPQTTAMLLNAPGSRPPLYWLDAGPLMRGVMRRLSPDQPAFALNMTPDDEKELGAGTLSIPEIAARLKLQLMSNQAAGPYYVGGWCRWGIVAYELTRQLVADGETVGLLILLDADRPGFHSPRDWVRAQVQHWLRPSLQAGVEEPASFSQRVEIATKSYRPQPSACDVLLLRPADSVGDAGWGATIDGHLSVECTPGDHVSMVRGEAAQALATALDRALLAAQQGHAAMTSPVVRAADTA